MEEEEQNKILKGIAYLCFIPYPSDNNNTTGEDNDNDEHSQLKFNVNRNTTTTTTTINNNNNNNTYHWFQGIFISLPDKVSYGLMGDTAESPPIPHPCCYPDKNSPPKFYNLTMIDYATNRKTYIKYILQTGGDNVSLSTEWEPDNFVMDEKIRKIKRELSFFEFHTLNVKYNEETVSFMKKYLF
ncbi:hypothetical protein PIROE2DRAFT_62724 [Piromyces sp. E2]|nr:hypothetical protein PIROE2DRAFT_62724 [Piromyces sp. E2]|eukprot:OUM61079.1 hypothetical protein PIROE2DRAFT_62724 [Piromyces sp. E2]